MYRIFLHGRGMKEAPGVLQVFQKGLHEAFLLSFAHTMAGGGSLVPAAVEPGGERPDAP